MDIARDRLQPVFVCFMPVSSVWLIALLSSYRCGAMVYKAVMPTYERWFVQHTVGHARITYVYVVIFTVNIKWKLVISLV
jgi:hypothetical protein